MFRKYMEKQLIIQVKETRIIESLHKMQRREMFPSMRGFRSYGAESKHEERGVNSEHCRSLFILLEINSWNKL